MSKRNLNRRQRHRIQKVQEERLERARKKDILIDAKLEEGELSEPQSGVIVAHFGVTTDVEDTDGRVIRCHKRSNLPALVTGDEVLWQEDSQGSGVIVACQERSSLLSRPDVRGQLRPVAANIDHIIIVAAPAPRTPVNLIDRYLVAAAHHGIPPILLLNKSDKLDQAPEMRREMAEYQALGYEVHIVSAQTEAGMAEIRSLVADGNAVFVGQSGVGKSSIIAALLPEEDIRVAAISEATGKGRHTTTTAKLYHIPNAGNLIDSPGIREFGLWHIDPQDLFQAFPELADLTGHCKFRDCSHENEPGCAVRTAVEEGRVLERRYRSYLAIRDSLDEVAMRELLEK